MLRMKHRNLQTGESMETDEQRKARTDLSSLRMTDNASKAVQKTPNRVSLDSMLAKIVAEEVWYPSFAPHMTVIIVKLNNGFMLLGKSVPADEVNYDRDLGYKFAKEDAIRQMWQLEAYLLREKMTRPVGDTEDSKMLKREAEGDPIPGSST